MFHFALTLALFVPSPLDPELVYPGSELCKYEDNSVGYCYPPEQCVSDSECQERHPEIPPDWFILPKYPTFPLDNA